MYKSIYIYILYINVRNNKYTFIYVLAYRHFPKIMGVKRPLSTQRRLCCPAKWMKKWMPEFCSKGGRKESEPFNVLSCQLNFDSVCIDRTPRCRDAMWDAISWIQSTSKHQLSWNFRSIFWNIFKQWLLILLCLQSKQNPVMPLHCRCCGGSIKLHLFWELVLLQDSQSSTKKQTKQS